MRTRTSLLGLSVTILGVVVGIADALRAADGPAAVVPQATGTPTPTPIAIPAPASRMPVRQYQESAWGTAYVGQSGHYHDGSAECEPGCERCITLCGYVHCPWHHKRKGCNYSPDHGWSPPTETPIVRVPVQYQRYWPQRWAGEPRTGNEKPAPRFPMVYMPTDTTQLGYYYHRVPQWSRVNGTLPPEPWPSYWHGRGGPTYRQIGARGPIGVRQARSGELPQQMIYETTNTQPVSSPIPLGQQLQPVYGVPPAPAMYR